MDSAPPHLPQGSSRTRTGVIPEGKGREVVGVRHYTVPRERGFALALVISICLFTLAAVLGVLIPAEEKLPPMIEVELGIDLVENEPPPLGEPDAGLGAQTPEPPPEAEPPRPMPEPEPEPAMEQAPQPEFTVPKEEEPPPPKPKPEPVAKVLPKSRKPLRTEAALASEPAGSGLTTGRAGVRGSPDGKPGGKGGGRDDFISTPPPQYDVTARRRGYEGRGVFMIRYENGKIVSVSAVQSTGVSYLDARSIAWISSRWRVKKGTSGAATLPITWRLR
jgi:outer membrane biosynthesis protein TonB